MYRHDVLVAAWWLVWKNNGAAGVDGQSCQDIIDGPGAAAFLRELQEELRTRRYRPQPVKRVSIPKPDGRQRPLGIPTVKDRIVQTAVLLVVEPIFEADFVDSSYDFRPGRSAQDALDVIRPFVGEHRPARVCSENSGRFAVMGMSRRNTDRSSSFSPCISVLASFSQTLPLIRK